MASRLLMLAVVAAACTRGGAASAAITSISAQRTTSTSATGAAPETDTSIALGFDEASATSAGETAAGIFNAVASSFSTVPNTIGPEISGHAELGVLVNATVSGLYSVSASSQFDTSFTVTENGYYKLDIGVHWEGIRFPLAGFASVQLSDVTNSRVLKAARAEVQTFGQGVDSQFTAIVLPLRTGITYRLFSETLATGENQVAGMYNANAFSTFMLSPGFGGDYDGSGLVDAADYVAWRDGLDTIYTQEDYSVWRANYGRMAAGGGQSVTSVVPEPAPWLHVVLALMTLVSIPRSQFVRGGSQSLDSSSASGI